MRIGKFKQIVVENIYQFYIKTKTSLYYPFILFYNFNSTKSILRFSSVRKLSMESYDSQGVSVIWIYKNNCVEVLWIQLNLFF